MSEIIPVIIFIVIGLLVPAVTYLSSRKKVKQLEEFSAARNFRMEKSFTGFKITGSHKSFDFEVTKVNKDKQVFLNFFIKLPASQNIIMHINSDNPILKLIKNFTGIQSIKTENPEFDKKFKVEAEGAYQTLLKNMDFQTKLLRMENFSSLNITPDEVILEVVGKELVGAYILKYLEAAADIALMVQKAQGLSATPASRQTPTADFSKPAGAYSAAPRLSSDPRFKDSRAAPSLKPAPKTAPQKPPLYAFSSQKQATGKLCPRCRADLKGNNKMCPSCGFKLKKSIFDFFK